MSESLLNLPHCGLCGEPVRQGDIIHQNRHVHEECYAKVERETLADASDSGGGAEARPADAIPSEPRKGAEGALRDAGAISGTGEQKRIKTHEFIKANNGACSVCGFGFGALEHNTTQAEWQVVRGSDYPQPSLRRALRGTDPINHPAHYGGDVPHEVIKCLEAWGLDSDALLWNTVKYIARSGKKGAALQDLEKARFYLDRRIARLK